MTTIEKIESDIEALKTEIEELPRHVRSIYIHGLNFRTLYAEKLTEIKSELLLHSKPDINDFGNTMGQTFHLTQQCKAGDLVHRKFLLDLVEESEEFREAVAIVQPMVDQLGALQAGLEAANEARRLKASKLREAERAATEKALADPKILAIRKELAEVS